MRTQTPSPEPSPTPGYSLEQLESAQIHVCEEFVSAYLTSCLGLSAYQLYYQGVQSGNDAHRFLVIGDSNSVPAVFMGQYERCCADDFQVVADWYAGSFAYSHALRQNGLSVMDFTPQLLNTEITIHNPSIAFIALGSNWGGGAADWKIRYERIITSLINDHQVLPVLWTVSDTPHLNIEIRSLAEKYQIPLVEWASVGRPYLSPDGVHFTVEGWTVRSRVGLVALSQLQTLINSYESALSQFGQ